MISLLQYVEETASTNDDLMRQVIAGAPHGTGIYAGAQNKGKGRQGRAWHSPKGMNLALSVAIVGPQFARDLPMLPLAVGVAIAELLESQYGIQTQLKWPNDLLIDERKLGGILCEGAQVGATFKGAIAGVGLNLNGTLEDYPEDLHERIITLRMIRGDIIDVATSAGSARRRIVEEAEALAGGGKESLLERWRARDVTHGREVEWLQDGRVGIAEGIDNSGALRLRFDDGSLALVRSGEVHLRPRRSK